MAGDLNVDELRQRVDALDDQCTGSRTATTTDVMVDIFTVGLSHANDDILRRVFL